MWWEALGWIIRRSVRARMVGAAGLLALCGWTWAQQPPPAEAFFVPAGFGQPRLSPDGRAVAMLVRGADGHRQLAVVDLDTLKPQVVASVKGEDVEAYEWVNSRRLIYWLRVKLTGPNRTDSGPGLYAVNKDGSRHRALKQTELRFVNAPEDGVPLLDWRWFLQRTLSGTTSDDVIISKAEEVSRERIGHFALQRLNTLTGQTRDIDTPLHSVSWVFDAEGRVVAATTRDKGDMTMQMRQPDGSFRTAARFPAYGASSAVMVPLAATAQGALIVEAPNGPTMAVWTFDQKAGRLAPQPLLQSPHFDLRPQPVLTAKGLAGLRVQVEAEATQWFDADAQALQETIDSRLADTNNRVSLPYEGDSPWVLVESQSDVKPMQAYVYHRSSKRLVRLGETLPGLDPARLGRMQFERVKARDGLSIPTYLTLPPGAKVGQPAPLVVLVHGGPWVRGMSWRFDAEVQFLASRGYAVLQPEFRGSTGFGHAHFEAGWRQWGRAMQDDLTDAVRWAIAQGHADPQRVCIAGASYGGYAAMMALVREPDLFRCAVNWVGVTDPGLLFSVYWSDITSEFKTHGATRLIGDPQADAEHFKSISPLHQAERIKAPVFMAYGAWDERVPLIHGERLRDALKGHNRAVEWVVYPEEGHGWRQPETQHDFWRRVEAFLARHLGPGARPPAAAKP